MQLVRGSLRNPYLVTVLVLVVVVLGVVSLLQIPSDLLPIYKTPAIQILTLYPGMPPEVVERDMTSRLERWTGQAVGIEHQEATSMLGVSIVKDFFREDIDPDAAMAQVTSLAVSDMFYLPPGTLPPMVMPFDPTASVPLCLLSVFSEGKPEERMDEGELYDKAYYEMRNRLQAINGVIAPAVYGGKLRRILVYVDRQQLEARKLSPMDVVEAIQKSNPFVPIGNMKLGDYDNFVLSNAMVEEVPELNDVPVKIDGAAPIFIKDVGSAEDTSQIQTNIVRIDGNRQVYIPIYRQPGANTLAIVDEVSRLQTQILQRIKEFDPSAKTLNMDVVMDQSEFVRGSIWSLVKSGILGALLVVVVVFFFLRSVGSTVLVVVSVPLAILGAFAGLYFTGDTINAMTLGGLSLSIGILVDQAIVVVENINRHLRMGKSPMKAAYDGGREVALPVVVATITFVVVFYPVVFLSGMARYLFTPLALAVSFAAVVSCVIALTFIPAVASRFFKPGGGASDEVGRFASGYGALVRDTLRMRWVVVLLAGGLFVASGFGSLFLGSELFPPVDAGQFTVLMRAPLGTKLEKTEEIVAEVEQAIMNEIGLPPSLVLEGEDEAESDLKLVISNIGVLYDWPAAYTPNTGPMDAFLLVQLKDGRTKSSQEWARVLRDRLPKQFPHVDFAFDTGGMLTSALNFGLPSPIDIQVQGSQLPVLHEIAGVIADEARQVEGAVDVRIAQPLKYPAIQIEVDRTRAAYVGLTQEEVIQNVATAINSSCNFEPSFWIAPNGNHYLIGAQYAEEAIESLETLSDIPITGSNSSLSIPLGNVAKFKRTTMPPVITHRNITRTVDVFVNVDGRDVGSVMRDIENRLATSKKMKDVMGLYGTKGYEYTARGEVLSMRESLQEFGFGLGIAAVLVYLVMVAQFRSFALPLVVVLTIPLAFFGVVAIMLLTGTNLSIPSFLGLILMVGIVVEYSILLVEFAVRRQREGVPIDEAIVDAARARFRPVLMTALTTAIALIPLAIGLGKGGESNTPLARAIIGAVVGGAALTLLVTPSLYRIIAGRLRFSPVGGVDELGDLAQETNDSQGEI